MSTEIRPAHSPLGASGAERWMNCPGSVALLNELVLPTTDEPEYRTEGTAAHDAGHKCLVEGLDAWEVIGETFGKVPMVFTAAMSAAVQVWLDEARRDVHDGCKVYNEFKIDAPEFHKDFYGTLDRGVVDGTLMRVKDYKHGEGVVVEVERNPQIMYYAYGLLRHHPEVERVELTIVQPRAFHADGPIRSWECSADYIREWAETELIGAMHRTEMDNDLDAGKWCRFCPAKLVCPLMTSLFGAAMTANPAEIVQLSDRSLGRSYQYLSAVEQYIKAMKEEAFRRLQTGAMESDEHGIKLVNKKAHRVWKPEARAVLASKFEDKAFTRPELKSPAEMEKISPEAKALVKEYAFTPDTGLTVALTSDQRVGVVLKKPSEAFADAIANLTETS